MRVLVTGAPGFIGTHTVKALLLRNHEARVLDNVDPHVYPDDGSRRRLDPRVECIIGDVLNPDNVALALCDVDAIVHLAALTVNPNMEGVRSSIDLIEKAFAATGRAPAHRRWPATA
jgi:nucleoside-diphosphate-sugar epimerase